MKHPVIEQENKSTEAILKEVEICLNFIKQERQKYTEKAEKSEDQIKWLENKMEEWEILKKVVEALKKKATILDKVILKLP